MTPQEHEEVRREIQKKLAEARMLLHSAGAAAEEIGMELNFMGMVFEPHFGWFTPDGELQEESEWNDSACVIGSMYAKGYGMEGWQNDGPQSCSSRVPGRGPGMSGTPASGEFFMRNQITIQTTEELDRALEEIRVATGRATKSEVIRDSLELYDLIVQQLIAGKRLYLGMARESAGEVLLPHLERARRRASQGPDLSAALVSVDEMAERIEQMRPVYEACINHGRAVCTCSADVGHTDGCAKGDAWVAMWTAIEDAVLAHTVREQAKESK